METIEEHLVIDREAALAHARSLIERAQETMPLCRACGAPTAIATEEQRLVLRCTADAAADRTLLGRLFGAAGRGLHLRTTVIEDLAAEVPSARSETLTAA